MPELLCKVCGLTRSEDVALCHSLGAAFTGFIFVPSSPRFVLPRVVAALPGGPALRVGVFAGMDRDAVRRTARSARLDMIQLHGGENVDFCRAMGPERVIKVLWPEALSPEALALELERFAPVCAYFLLDAGTSGGGSGGSLSLAGLCRTAFPRPWLLAGGLGPATLVPALDAFAPGFGPDGADMNSALESAPGVKNPELLRAALALAKDIRRADSPAAARPAANPARSKGQCP